MDDRDPNYDRVYQRAFDLAGALAGTRASAELSAELFATLDDLRAQGLAPPYPAIRDAYIASRFGERLPALADAETLLAGYATHVEQHTGPGSADEISAIAKAWRDEAVAIREAEDAKRTPK